MDKSIQAGSVVMGQKKIVVVDNDEARGLQISTILSFVGENFVHCSQSQVLDMLADTSQVLTVILTGDVSAECCQLIKKHPRTPFLLHDVIDSNALTASVNVIGTLSTPLNYAQLTELDTPTSVGKLPSSW